MDSFVSSLIVTSFLTTVANGQLPSNCSIKGSLLDCYNCGLRSIPDLSQLPISINTLDFSYNGISAVFNLKAKTGNNITHIRLDHNLIGDLDDAAFHVFTNLVNLDLSFNDLADLMVNTSKFSGMPNLEILSLAYNPINTLSSLARAFDSYGKLKQLNMSNTKMVFIQTEALQGLSALEVLDLSHNGIFDLSQWGYLQFDSLVTINLSYNHLKELGASAFSSCPKLQDLVLAHNVIEKFPNLDKISATKIDLACNKLKSLESDSSVPQTTKTPALASGGVQDLNVSQNLIENIGDNLSPKLQTLESLDLSHNHLQLLSNSAFSAFPQMLELDLSYNNISNLNGVMLPETLGAIDIHSNNLQEIPTGAITNLMYLYYLILDRNPIKSVNAIPRPVEGFNIYARWVSMQHMPDFESISDIGFQHFVSMEYINLSKNPKLTTIGHNAFAKSKETLQAVIIKDSNLTSITEDLLSWSDMEQLDLTGNNFVCDKQLCWMLEKKVTIQGFLNNIRQVLWLYTVKKFNNHFTIHLSYFDSFSWWCRYVGPYIDQGLVLPQGYMPRCWICHV
ncbi:hypothetical protein FSP39_011636 [Pinctada imbricata]|uniref:Toll-like receptor 3 n=1 Tax=Pinctada imbricata TaxID=66713 RepID=A0AA88XU27_PINIB|nr:hypothetical protein FSP39_011636 [Pinctada imbricata]